MEDKFIILKETECPDCSGTGSEKARFFNEFFNERKVNPSITLQEYEKIWVEDYLNGTPRDICRGCKGNGRVRVEVNLEEALEKITKKGCVK